MLPALSLLISVAAVLIALVVERISGAERAKNVSFNTVCGFLDLAVAQFFMASITPSIFWLSSKIGKPPIHLSGRGWMFPMSLFVMLAVLDMLEYFLHRLQHGIPWLWAMHSFHHSDPALNATSAYRGFWLDHALLSVWLLPVGFVFRADGNVLLAVIAASWALNVFQHSNIRVGLSKYSWLIVTPQFHRTHHSIRQEHYDRNFSGFLPLWDVIFGTYAKPEGYPETGLIEGEPRGVKDALLWAFRR